MNWILSKWQVKGKSPQEVALAGSAQAKSPVMKLTLLVLCLLGIATTVLAWTKEDHEIFDIVSALEAAEGKKTTFYSWLEVSPSASTADIGRAYRKKSLELHPDKNQGVLGAPERFARLGTISGILRNPESRARYDFFFKNGVPKWRGTGYYYSRWRPGMVTVLTFLVILTSSLQYLTQFVTQHRDFARVKSIADQAKIAAWGSKGNQNRDGRKKVKVYLGDSTVTDEQVECIVETDGQVFLIDGEAEIPLDHTFTHSPSFKRTWPVSLATFIGQKLRIIPALEVEASEYEEEGPSEAASETNGDSKKSKAKGTVNSAFETPLPKGAKRRKSAPPKKK